MRSAFIIYPDDVSVRWIDRIADAGIDVLGIHSAGGTDAARISVSGRGVDTVAISLATRYLHSPVSTGSPKDMEDILAVSRAFLAEV